MNPYTCDTAGDTYVDKEIEAKRLDREKSASTPQPPLTQSPLTKPHTRTKNKAKQSPNEQENRSKLYKNKSKTHKSL